MNNKAATVADGRKLPAVFRALRHRNYQLFFGGQLISLVGTWMQSIAQAWLVYRLTGSATLLGLVGFVGQIPVFLISPFGGVVADRHNRHRIVVTTQTSAMLLAFILAALTLLRVVQVWHIMVLASMLGMVNAFDVPARQAFIVEMVEPEDMMNAIALNSSMVNGARIIGPAVAGVVVAAVGEGWCFFANGVSYIAVIVGLLMMTPTFQPRLRAAGSALANLREGFRYVVHTAPIRAVLLLLGLVSVTGMPYAVLMPIFADRILHGGARGLGLLMGASGVGALLGSLTLAAKESVRGLGRWVAYAAAGFGASLMLFSFSKTFWLSAALLVPTGFSMMVQMASSNTLLQTMSSNELRGRVMAIYTMMFMGMAPVGSLLAGFFAGQVGAPATVAGGGVFCVIGAVTFGLQLPALRAEARKLIVAHGMAGGDPPDEVTAQGAAD